MMLKLEEEHQWNKGTGTCSMSKASPSVAKAAGIENDVGLVRIAQKKLPKITRNDNAKVRNIRGPQENAESFNNRRRRQ